MKSRNNIYFRESSDFDYGLFKSVEARRISDWQKGTILAPVKGAEGVFTRVEARPSEGNFVVWTSQQHPEPPRWPSILPFRQPITVYGNGSAMGFVRRRTIPVEAQSVRKLKVTGRLRAP